eukprot:m.143599 g.143599  ORF g.143599 m.143599 type:complete len:1523 (-) comp9665_c0_seq1:137-4705(-)
MGKRPAKPKRAKKHEPATLPPPLPAAGEPSTAAFVDACPPDMCAAEYLRSLPEGLTEVRVPVFAIHALLLRLANIAPEDLCKAQPADHADPPGAPLEPRADARAAPRLATEAEALEAAVMASLPADIVERIYDRFDIEGCRCPAGCPGLLHIDDFEQHCIDHAERDLSAHAAAAAAVAPAHAAEAAPAAAHPALALPGPAATSARVPSTQAQPEHASGPEAAHAPAVPIQAPAAATEGPVQATAPALAPPGPVPTPIPAAPAPAPALSPAASVPDSATGAAPALSPAPSPPAFSAPAAAPASATPDVDATEPLPVPPDLMPLAQELPQTAPAYATVPAPEARTEQPCPVGCAGPCGGAYNLAWLAEHADTDELDEATDYLDNLDELTPMPEFYENGTHIVLRIPPRPAHLPPLGPDGRVDGETEEDEGLEAVLEWLFFDAEQAAADRWPGLFSIFRRATRRIAELSERIDRREHILRIRGQIATEYQRRLSGLQPAGDADQHRRRMYVEEVSCLAAVTHHYLAITRHRLEAVRSSLARTSSVARRMQENIAELARHMDTHRAEIDRLDASELEMLREELQLAHEGGKAKRKPRTLEADRFRQAKDDLNKKIESCQRKSAALREKYMRMLKTLLGRRERVAAHEAMEAPLARLHTQALMSLHEHDPAAHPAVPVGTTAEPLGRPLTTQDLQPILDFEKQETDILDQLMDDHGTVAEAKGHVLELLRELAYTDPFVKVLKEAILQRLEHMAAEARLRRQRHRIEAEKDRIARRAAIERALIEDEAEARRKLQEKERARRQAEKKPTTERPPAKEPPPEPPALAAPAAPSPTPEQPEPLPDVPPVSSSASSPATRSRSSPDLDDADLSDTSDARPPQRDWEEARKTRQRPLCRDYLRGCCPRGNTCAWVHVDGVEQSQPLCKDFQRGLCRRDPCAFMHVLAKTSRPRVAEPRIGARVLRVAASTGPSSEMLTAPAPEPAAQASKGAAAPLPAPVLAPAPAPAPVAPAPVAPATPALVATAMSAPLVPMTALAASAEAPLTAPVRGGPSDEDFPPLKAAGLPAPRTADPVALAPAGQQTPPTVLSPGSRSPAAPRGDPLAHEPRRGEMWMPPSPQARPHDGPLPAFVSPLLSTAPHPYYPPFIPFGPHPESSARLATGYPPVHRLDAFPAPEAPIAPAWADPYYGLHEPPGWAFGEDFSGAPGAPYDDGDANDAEGEEVPFEEQTSLLLPDDLFSESPGLGRLHLDPSRPDVGVGFALSKVDDALDAFLRAIVELLRHTPHFAELLQAAVRHARDRCLACAMCTLFQDYENASLRVPETIVTVEALRAALVSTPGLQHLNPRGTLAAPSDMFLEFVRLVFKRCRATATGCPRCATLPSFCTPASTLANRILNRRDFRSSIKDVIQRAPCGVGKCASDSRVDASQPAFSVTLMWDQTESAFKAVLDTIMQHISPTVDLMGGNVVAMLCQHLKEAYVFTRQSVHDDHWLEYRGRTGGPGRAIGAWEEVRAYCRHAALVPVVLIFSSGR